MSSQTALASAIIEQLAGIFTQNRRVLRLSTPLGAHMLLAETLRGEEAIDRGFRFQMSALALDAAIALKSLIGKPVLVELQTAGMSDQPRHIHGHVTGAELTGANGGFARYQLTIEPWTAFLGLGRDSRVFQDMNVFDILDAVFKSYDGKGQLTPAWRFDIRDRSVYPQRSLVTQYQESDLAFAERLMNEEGLFFFFEHQGDRDGASLGSHTLVIADHNDAFTPNRQSAVRFTQPGAVMQEDSLDRWRFELRQQTNSIELVSWDYRAGQQRSVASGGGEADLLVSRDSPGAYAYSSTAQGQRIADNQLQGLQARKEIFTGAGTVRTFIPGTTFTLHDHGAYSDDQVSFAILRVTHLAHNNLDADTGMALRHLLGDNGLDRLIQAELASSLHSTGRGAGERPVYRNRIDAIRCSVPYRPSRTGADGHVLHPSPSVRGQQTAIVVGPAGASIHTDRDHRIKIQFHWQRGQASHSRLTHPLPDGHRGATADDQVGTWVRVATPLAPVAGSNWGSHALPRVGQEVLVDFLDGQIDRPVVIGVLYNGQGQSDAQHNQVSQGAGAATGNAPAWFAGASGAHAHPATLSGIKTQSMAASKSGVGAYNQLVFDDSPGQARIALQRHAALHDGSAELNLGHLRHQSDNQRLGAAGFGAELKTEYSAALRAGQGLLLSSEAQGSGAGAQLDARAAQDQIEASHHLQLELAGLARKHNARIKDEPETERLAALVQLANSVGVIDGEDGEGSAAATQRPAVDSHAAAFSEPQLQLSAPGGIAATTPADAILTAQKTSSLSAGQDINLAAQGNQFFAVKHGIGMFTYGKADGSDKPNWETGIKLHAASGKVSMQSQTNVTGMMADKAITVASVTKGVMVQAKTYLHLNAQGAQLKLEGGNIELHGPGVMAFKASMKELAGPQGADTSASLPTPAKLRDCAQKLGAAAGSGSALVNL